MMRVSQRIDAALWILERLHKFGQDVGSIIPDGFEAYARIFHPPIRRSADGGEVPVRWQDIAAANGRSIQQEMQRLGISCEPSQFGVAGEELWNEQARSGTLPFAIADRLATILSAHKGTRDACWFAVWEGFAGLRIPSHPATTVAVPYRDMTLLHGALDDVRETLEDVSWINGVRDSQQHLSWAYRSPSLWWPADRSWCVATEVDFTWTYVGGSTRCIQQILEDGSFEAVVTTPDEGNLMEK